MNKIQRVLDFVIQNTGIRGDLVWSLFSEELRLKLGPFFLKDVNCLFLPLVGVYDDHSMNLSGYKY